MYNPTPYSNLRKGLYALLMAAACSGPTHPARIQGTLIEKLPTDKGQILKVGLTNIVEGAEALGLKSNGEIKVIVPSPTPEPYNSQLGWCLTQTTFGYNECDVDLEIQGRPGQKTPYQVTNVHSVNVKSPAEQAGEKALEKTKKGFEWLREKIGGKQK